MARIVMLFGMLFGSLAWSKEEALVQVVGAANLLPAFYQKLNLFSDKLETQKIADILADEGIALTEKILLDFRNNSIRLSHAKGEILKLESREPLVLSYRGKILPWFESRTASQNLMQILSSLKKHQNLSQIHLLLPLLNAAENDGSLRETAEKAATKLRDIVNYPGNDPRKAAGSAALRTASMAWMMYEFNQMLSKGLGKAWVWKMGRLFSGLIILGEISQVFAAEEMIPEELCRISGQQLSNTYQSLQGKREEKISFNNQGQPQELTVFVNGKLVNRAELNFYNGQGSVVYFDASNRRSEPSKDLQKQAYDMAYQTIATCRDPKERAQLLKDMEELKKILKEKPPAIQSPDTQNSTSKDTILKKGTP